MLKIGLTGGIGSGKSTVARCFAKLAATVIDSDLIAREVVAPNTPALTKIIKHFGNKILNSQEELDRKALRKLIFTNPKQRKWLENLLHPLIYQAMQEKIKQARSPYCILVIPLLLETKHEQFVDRILVVDAPQEQRINRVSKRDNITKTQIKTMINAQINRQQRLTAADDIIHNNKSLADLEKQVAKLHQKYLHILL